MSRVTSEAASDQAQPHPLMPGASPAIIRSWLATDEDRVRFLEDYAAALDRARDEVDLSAVHEVIEEFRPTRPDSVAPSAPPPSKLAAVRRPRTNRGP